MTTVAIIGLGLIGGSIARDLTALGHHVLGYDRGHSLAQLDEANIVIVAVPVSSLHEVLSAALPHVAKARLIMDTGSTKRSALAVAESAGVGERFVGSHPMAGDHRSGFAASRRRLFAGATAYLCPTPSTREDALEMARELWSSLGACPQVIDAEAHDRRVAFSSHLPQLVSTALALVLADAGVARDELGPGGADATRLAASSAELWTGIALDNAEALVPAIEALEGRLAGFRAALEAGDGVMLGAVLGAARAWTRGEL